MNTVIFKDRFFKEFVPSIEKYLKTNNLSKKAVLLLYNASTHPDEEELKKGGMGAIILPPNVMVICQPMDQVSLRQ